jgi:hypothetical protein
MAGSHLTVVLADQLPDCVWFVGLHTSALAVLLFDILRTIAVKIFCPHGLKSKKGAQGFYHVRVDPARDPLSLPFGANQANTLELLDVVRDRRFNHVDLIAKLTDIGCCCISIDKTDGAGFATGGQAQKYFQAIGIGKGLENFSIVGGIYIFIVRHILNYKLLVRTCQGIWCLRQNYAG